jgi:hypothetical protein
MYKNIAETQGEVNVKDISGHRKDLRIVEVNQADETPALHWLLMVTVSNSNQRDGPQGKTIR